MKYNLTLLNFFPAIFVALGILFFVWVFTRKFRFIFLEPQPSSDNVIYLTFDDGPNGEATKKTLEVLKGNNAHAIFFVIGKNVEREPALTRRIVREGHLVGNHSYQAGYTLAFQSKKRIRENLYRTNRIIAETTNVQPKYFRPPNGIMTASLAEVCRELKISPVGVHIFVNDSFIHNKEQTARKVLKRLKEGANILVLHDGFGTRQTSSRDVTAEALTLIMQAAAKRGYAWGNPNDIGAIVSLAR